MALKPQADPHPLAELHLLNAQTLFWGTSVCSGERIANWRIEGIFQPDHPEQQTVSLIGLLVRPAVWVKTLGDVPHRVEVEPEKVIGVIRVANMSFEKRVLVRASTDGWKTHTDYPAEHVPSIDVDAGNQPIPNDVFVFQTALAKEIKRLELAINYCWGQGNHGGECWDNNGGQNYVLRSDSVREAHQEVRGVSNTQEAVF